MPVKQQIKFVEDYNVHRQGCPFCAEEHLSTSAVRKGSNKAIWKSTFSCGFQYEYRTEDETSWIIDPCPNLPDKRRPEELVQIIGCEEDCWIRSEQVKERLDVRAHK